MIRQESIAQAFRPKVASRLGLFAPRNRTRTATRWDTSSHAWLGRRPRRIARRKPWKVEDWRRLDYRSMQRLDHLPHVHEPRCRCSATAWTRCNRRSQRCSPRTIDFNPLAWTWRTTTRRFGALSRSRTRTGSGKGSTSSSVTTNSSSSTGSAGSLATSARAVALMMRTRQPAPFGKRTMARARPAMRMTWSFLWRKACKRDPWPHRGRLSLELPHRPPRTATWNLGRTRSALRCRSLRTLRSALRREA
mmetsp:Transcript_83233/g.269432  ORF Transcript_83233/g.269432 Transcript_83233/m.269432 type:complete len:249 (+) Transcript_83233:26-772(+)